MTTDEKPTFRDHAEEIAWHRQQADGEGAESGDEMDPNACTECGEPFGKQYRPLESRQAKGFSLCIGCMIADGKEDELHDDDLDALGERNWNARNEQ